MPDAVGCFYLESWAAIVADPAVGAPRRYGGCAEDTAIPATMRRRLGAFARMVVSCGLSLVGTGDADLVLASQYGDLALAEGLLGDVVSGGLLSPAAFAMSVHNAPAGMLDIARNSRIGHTAIAAGAETLSAGLIEAWLRLHQRREMQVVLIYADEAPLWGLDNPREAPRQGIALALRLSATPPSKTAGQVAFSPRGKARGQIPSMELAARLVDCLSGGGDWAVAWQAQGFDWRFQGIR